MNRFLFLALFSTSILQSMESPNKIVIKLSPEEKFSDADQDLHDFAKMPLKPYSRRYHGELMLSELCEKRDREARAEAQEKIPAFLKAGAKIDSIDPVTKNTPLHLTIEANNAITMEVLLEHGADPNIRDELGITPLMDVVLGAPNNQSDPRIKILIEHGARIDRLKTAQNVEKCFKSLWFLARKKSKTDMNGLKKMIDQGAWVFFTWSTLWEALKLKEGKSAYNRSILELILTHPQPGPIWENEKIKPYSQSWLAFILAVKKEIPQFTPPRDIRLKIRDLVFPSADDFIYLVPTKNLSHYAWIFNKKKLLNKLVERHLKCARNLKPSEKDIQHLLPQIPADVLDFFDAEKRAAIIKPLLEKSYEQILTPQETKTT